MKRFSFHGEISHLRLIVAQLHKHGGQPALSTLASCIITQALFKKLAFRLSISVSFFFLASVDNCFYLLF